jgi:prohibitin 2
MNSDDKSVLLRIFGILGSVFLLVLLFCSFHIVPPGHRGVAVTLGSVQKDARAEGITLKMPFVTSIYDIPIKQITQNGVADAFSSDLQTMSITYNILYRIPQEKVVVLFQQYSGDPYEALIAPRIQEVLKENTALVKAEEVVKNREKLKSNSLIKMKLVMGDLIEVVDVVIANIDLTDELEKAIEKKQVMEQEALAKQYELQKQQKEAEITVVNAKAEADAIKLKGDALRESPTVIQLDIVRKWDGKAPLVIGSPSGEGAGIILPLPIMSTVTQDKPKAPALLVLPKAEAGGK